MIERGPYPAGDGGADPATIRPLFKLLQSVERDDRAGQGGHIDVVLGRKEHDPGRAHHQPRDEHAQHCARAQAVHDPHQEIGAHARPDHVVDPCGEQLGMRGAMSARGRHRRQSVSWQTQPSPARAR